MVAVGGHCGRGWSRKLHALECKDRATYVLSKQMHFEILTYK